MKWRNLGIVAALFLALGAYVYFYEVKGQKRREEAEEKAKKLFPFEEKDIASLTVKTADGEILLRKEKDTWKLIKPVEAKADKYAADGLASDVASAKVDRTLEDLKPDWKKYGLEPASARLLIGLSGGKTQELELGEKDFSESSTYARIPGQNRVLVLPASLLTSATKKLFDFRDKTVLEFQKDQTKEVSITVKGKEYAFEKSGDSWDIRKPFQSRGDRSEIDSILSDLEFARVEEFIQPPVGDLKTYGLNIPEARVDLMLGENRARKTLLVGKKVDKLYFAKDESRDAIFKIKEDLFKKLDLDPSKIRDKKVVRIERADMNRISVKLPDKEFDFAKGSDDKWKVEKPDAQKGKKVLEYKIFWPLEDLEGKDLIDNANWKDPKYGFGKPAAEIQLTGKDKKLTDVVFGKIENDRVYARTNNSETIYRVDKKVLDDLNFKMDDIVEK